MSRPASTPDQRSPPDAPQPGPRAQRVRACPRPVLRYLQRHAHIIEHGDDAIRKEVT